MRVSFSAQALLVAALGALATRAQAPYDQFWIAPVALALLFAVLRGQSVRRCFLLGWLFAFANFATGVYWIYIATHLFGHAPVWLGVLLTAVLTGAMALYPALAMAAASWLSAFTAGSGFVTIPALWMLGELLRGSIFHGGFPWLALGYGALDTPLARAAPLVGVYGVSALVVLCAVALYRVGVTRGSRQAFAAAVLIAPLLTLLLPHPGSWSHRSGDPLRVALVQANVGEEHKWDADQIGPIVERYRAQTLAATDADIVIWPEDALPLLLPDALEASLNELGNTLAARRQTLIAGVLTPFERPSGLKGIYNSAAFFGLTRGRYDKRHLVPFGEFFPVPDFLRHLFDVLGTPFSDFTPGVAEPALISVRGVPIALSICFEDVFPDSFRADAARAGVLVNITNDAWYGHSIALPQHLAFSRMRAIESSRWLARATPTGETAIIDPDGEVVARLQPFTTLTLRGVLEPRAGTTPFDRYGDLPLWIASIAIVLLKIALTLMPRRRP